MCISEKDKAILKGDYSEFINELEKVIKITGINNRLNLIAYLVGYYGYVNDVLLEMVYKAYGDGFIN